jgi:hypothetical protein
MAHTSSTASTVGTTTLAALLFWGLRGWGIGLGPDQWGEVCGVLTTGWVGVVKAGAVITRGGSEDTGCGETCCGVG